MAETLGSLCDKLTIVKLKQFHSEDKEKLMSLEKQINQLILEINELVLDAINGLIPVDKLTFRSNKVFKSQGNEIQEIHGEIGDIFSKLAEVNCILWHEQEKVYEFEKVPVSEKDIVIKQLSILNLERTECIDKINENLVKFIEQKKKKN